VMAITKSAYLVSAIDVLKSGRSWGPLLGRDPVAAALCMIPTTISRFCRGLGCPCGQLWERGGAALDGEGAPPVGRVRLYANVAELR
jgi:hypothetical protein